MRHVAMLLALLCAPQDGEGRPCHPKPASCPGFTQDGEGWACPPKPVSTPGGAQDGEGWALEGWKHRRRLTLRSQAEEALKAGLPVGIDVDAAYLGLAERCAKGFADVAVAFAGRRIPAIVRPSPRDGHFELWFRLPENLPAGAKESRYAVYYGNAAARPNPAGAADVFEIYEDFSGTADRLRASVDPGLSATLSGGRLVITDVAAERSERAPGKITLRDLPPAGGFSLSADLEIDPAPGAAFALALVVDLREDVPEDPAALKRVGELADKLGDPDWETRETATRELVAAGRLALKRLEEAARSADAEVKWRAEQAIAQIRAVHPAATIVAAVRAGDGTRHAARSARIGRTRGDYPGAIALPARLTITINRDADGDVEILWNGVRPDRGAMKGELKEISLQLTKGTSGALGRIALDTISVRRWVDEEARPTHTLDVEETKP